jgi:hypothetical protein
MFSNSISNNVLYVTRFEVDWSSKNSTALTINLINPKTITIALSTTSFEGSAQFIQL